MKSIKKLGRPEYQPDIATSEAVKCMVAAGITQKVMAAVLKIAPNTLTKHYAAELETGKDALIAHATGKLMQAVNRGELAAIFFFLKCRAGWQEKQQVTVTGADGKDLIPSTVIIRPMLTPGPPTGSAND